MTSLVLDLAAPLGALLAMIGAAIQLAIDLSERLSYMRRAGSLDPQGATAARIQRPRMRFRYPEHVLWIPHASHAWLRARAPQMIAWLAVALGSALLFLSSIRDLWNPKLPLSIMLVGGLFATAMLVSVFVSAVVAAPLDRAGIARAEADWRSSNPGSPVRSDSESRAVEFLEHCHRLAFGPPID